MALRDPVAVYTAANNNEAQLVGNILNAAGVEAFVTEDVSQIGVWMFGLLPEIHRPKVYVDRASVAEAKVLVEQYDQDSRDRQERDRQQLAESGGAVEVTCEDCGRSSTFPIGQAGSIQDCPHCGAYLDVGDSVDSDVPWQDAEPTDKPDGAS